MNPLRTLFPDGASTVAGEVDSLFYFLCALSFVVALALFVMIIFFAIRYHAKAGKREPMRGNHVGETDLKRMELAGIGVTLAVFMVIFYWGAKLFAGINTPPPDAMQVFIVGKQWMWKSQHLGGRREINQLHVPLGRAVKLTMTSEDVIHSFYIPAFRVKTDVLPGRYTTMWFQPTKVGEFHLFCAEYCGTKHSEMIGKIVVMEPRDFQAWLSQGGQGSLAETGEKLFNELGCNSCHRDDGDGRGPRLRGLFGSTVELQSGGTVVADEGYLRDAILEPNKHVVAGYQPVMPSYVAQLNEEKVIQLIAFIKSLEAKPGPAAKASASAATTAAPVDTASAAPADSAAPATDASAGHPHPDAAPARSAAPADSAAPAPKGKGKQP
jgi:cytochrome c oxidase subunit 2